MSTNAFTPLGKTCSQTANIGGALPAPIQVPSLSGQSPSTHIVWNSTSTAVWLGYGATSALATANAVIPTGTGANATQCVSLPGNTIQTFTFPPDSFFCGITSAGTSAVYITPGDGL